MLILDKMGKLQARKLSSFSTLSKCSGRAELSHSCWVLMCEVVWGSSNKLIGKRVQLQTEHSPYQTEPLEIWGCWWRSWALPPGRHIFCMNNPKYCTVYTVSGIKCVWGWFSILVMMHLCLQFCNFCPLLCSLQLTLQDYQFTSNLAL